MTLPHRNINFTDWVLAFATTAQLQARVVGDKLIAVTCAMPGRRSQTAWIQLAGQDARRNTVVRFSSPALKIKAGSAINARLASLLLRQNGVIFHGAWAIEQIEGDEYLAVVETQIIDTMDLPEFSAAIWTVTTMADTLEKAAGQDRF